MLFPQILACCFFVDKEEWDNVKLIAEIALKQLASVKHDTGLQLVKSGAVSTLTKSRHADE